MELRLPNGQVVLVHLEAPTIRDLNLGGWSDPLGQLKDWIVGKLKAAAEAVWDIIKGAWDEIIKGISSAVGWISDKVKTALEILQGLAYSVRDLVVRSLKEAWDAVITGISSAVGWIKDKIGSILETLKGIAGAVRDAVVGALKSAWDAVIKGISSTVGWIRDALSEVWGILKKIGSIVMDAVGAVATAFLGAIRDFFSTLFGLIWNGIKAIAGAIESAFSWVIGRVKGALGAIWDKVISLAPKSPEEVPTKLPAMAVELGLAGLGTMVTLDACGVEVMGSGLKLDGLKHYLREIFSPGLVQGVLIGAVLTSGVGPFVSRWVQSTFRTWLPSPEEAFTLWVQGYIDENRLREILAQHGTPEGLMAGRIDLCDYTPPVMELTRIAQYSDLDLDWLESKLAENRIHPRDYPKYRELFLQISLRRIHQEFWSSVESALAYGTPPEADFTAWLSDLRLRSFLHPYYIQIFRIRLATQRVKQWLEAYEEQVYRGLLAPETAVEQMVALGVDKSYACARVAYQMARRGVLWTPPQSSP